MSTDLKKIYENRFSEAELEKNEKIWKVLCENYFQKFIARNTSVVDIGAGYCAFINNINCGNGQKFAVDLNSDTRRYAGDNVIVYHCSSTHINEIDDDSVDVVFMSNFLEHMKNKEKVSQSLSEAFRILKQEGILMILQPNIRYCYKEYWDFFDHYTPLSHKSLAEALTLLDFQLIEVVPKFLPYTSKSLLPQWPILIKVYLRFPILWRIFGKQMFLVAKK